MPSTRPTRPSATRPGPATPLAALAGALLLLAATPGPARAQEEGLAVGARPAAVVLEDLEGHPVELRRWIGHRPVLVEFWATWCPICRALQPRMEAAHDRFGDRVEFIAVAVGVRQTPASIRRHLRRLPMPGRVLWDGEGRAVRAFRAPGTGYVVVLNAAGEVVYTGTGPRQDLQAAVARALTR